MPTMKKMLRNQMNNMRHITLLLVIIFNLFVYNYVLNLERTNCDCSSDWRRDFIKYYSLVALVISTSLFVTGLSGSNVRLPAFFTAVFSLFGLFNAFVLFFYTRNLMGKDNCDCSSGRVRTALHYLSAFRVVLTLLALLSAVILLLVLNRLF